MTEIYENYLCNLPTELLLYIFDLMSPKELMKCRKVCRRWKEIIDPRAEKDDLWRKFTIRDFSNIYKSAIKKTYGCKQWYDIYRSLSLWPKINSATESKDEFAFATRVHDEIQDFVILSDGIIAIHKITAIDYYNIDTMEKCNRKSIPGDIVRYEENDDTVIILGNAFHLHILRKIIRNEDHKIDITFHNTKLFLVADRKVFFMNLNNEIFLCDLDEDLRAKFLKKYDNIMTLSYCDGLLYALTKERNIYKLVGNEFILVCLLANVSNFLDCLKKYNFLENLSWRMFCQWTIILKVNIPDRPLNHILNIYPYGDVYFVGSDYGVLRIYISPYTAGELDIYTNEPAKQYNFMERSDFPVLLRCPIIRINVMEVKDGHRVIVAMPKKIAVLNFIHNFDKEISFKVYPYDSKFQPVEY